MYDLAGESKAKKTQTLLNENLTDWRPQNEKNARSVAANCRSGKRGENHHS